MFTRNFSYRLIACVLLQSFSTALTAQDTLAKRYASMIDAALISKHVRVLASDSLEGRETAKPGMEKAARYVAGEFRNMGLPPLANGTYYQEVPFIKILPGWMTIDGRRRYNDIQEFYSTQAVGSVSINAAEIVFAGFGITDSASGWNDLKGVDASGKVVMILEGEPKDKKGNPLAGKTEHSRESRIENLKQQNPKAILLVRRDYEDRRERVSKWISSGVLTLDDPAEYGKAPLITISPAMANEMLKSKKLTIESYEAKVASRKKPQHVVITDSLFIKGKQTTTHCYNVLGYVEGTDLKNELVIITAHLDHLGMRNGDIYYGADDDGSGCASVLAMANAMAQAKKDGQGPRRSVLFMTFTGEEKGLFGSEYYVEHPVFPLSNTIANLNIDMIGRVDTVNGPATDYVYVIGANRTSDTLHAVNERMNAAYSGLKLDYKYNDPSEKLRLYYRSDHYNFIKKQVPSIFFFTGLHPDYHKPTDTADKIDYEKTARIARHIFHTAWELSHLPYRTDVKPQND
jgi:hypothetical protein